MALSKGKKDRIAEIIKEILIKRIDNFPEIGAEIRNAPFHQAILEHFKKKLSFLKVEMPYLIAIASWLHGLNTSLGTGFENISHILSNGYKRKFSGAYKLKVKKEQASKIEAIIRNLKAGLDTPNTNKENKEIFKYSVNDSEIDSLDFTVDTYIEKKGEIIAIELKSVRPNSGEGRGEKQKILYAKAALKLLNPNKRIKYFVGFPFDPTSIEATAYDKQRFFNYLIEFKKFFSPEEILIADELWDFLSGDTNTMNQVLAIIKETVSKVKK